MGKMNFKALQVKDIEGNNSTLDIAKELGNMIFRQTSDLGELELARRIYKGEDMVLSVEEAGIVKRYVEEGFLAFVKESLIPQLDEIINPK
ncbi:hypothetical protein [Bacteroides pyogenes]|uniref:hypothetical protein n=1 Tax=Bacteroides pyogenes TaxID=310300 RepID=UPI001BA84185|nr:hypothetical protein [Bacteroides pyogenes]